MLYSSSLRLFDRVLANTPSNAGENNTMYR
jgi:hypothetical protein